MFTSKMLFLFSSFIFCLYVEAKAPQICEEMTFEIYDDRKQFKANISGTLKVTKNNDLNFITLNNVEASFTNGSQIIPFPNASSCVANFPINDDVYTCARSFPDSIIFVFANITNIWPPWYYAAIVDEGSLSFSDGSIFDENNRCYTSFDDYGEDLKVLSKSCCTSFKPLTVIAPEAPLCLNFLSVTKIYNTTQDDNLWKNEAVNFALNDGEIDFNITFHSSESEDPDKFITLLYGINKFVPKCIEGGSFGDEFRPEFCHIPIIQENYKFFIYVSDDRNKSGFYSDAIIAKFIFRDNQTLMQEGVPFTPTNKCKNTSVPYVDSILKNEFCCTEFQSHTSDDNNSPTLFGLLHCLTLTVFITLFY